MSGEIFIDYDAVYNKTAELRRRIESELNEMDATYRQVHSSLRRMDGKHNATFMETMNDNQRKARLTAETLHELLSFIESSAKHVERNEKMHTRIFTSLRRR